MANFDSSLYTAQASGLSQTPTPQAAGQCLVAYASVAVTDQLASADLIRFFYLPKNAKIVHAVLRATDLDTDGTPAITIDVGWSGSAAGLFSNSTVGQAGTTDTNCIGNGSSFTDETLIYGTVDTVADVKAAGTVYLTVFYTLEA